MAVAGRKFGRGCLPIFRQNTFIWAETMRLFIAAYQVSPCGIMQDGNVKEGRAEGYVWGLFG
jgi:hypothetical protein